MTDAATIRFARQILATDQCLGMDVVPVSGRVPPHVVSRPAREVAPAANARPARAAQTTAAPTRSAPRPTLEILTLNREEKIAALAELCEQVTAWAQENWPRDGWRNVVFGEGDPDAKLMFIGEGPGEDEDAQGRPFVGRAGQLLDKQIEAMGLQRSQVFIANIAKTRPPGNRVPTPDEAEQWMPWLQRQIQIISPRVIVALGATSAKYLLEDPRLMITRERGKWRDFHGIRLMPTFHPAYLLRSYTKENRGRVWDDLKQVLAELGLPVPKKQG